MIGKGKDDLLAYYPLWAPTIPDTAILERRSQSCVIWPQMNRKYCRQTWAISLWMEVQTKP
jgi:hypothetical protein